MADGNPTPNPIPDPPPAEPFDVEVTPDPPPAQPFDVPTFPDAVPWEPSDVPVVLSPPPAPAVDLTSITLPSRPFKPHPVGESPSPPLPEPFEPAIDLPQPPADPVDLTSIVPSLPPAGARQPQFWPENQQQGVQELQTLSDDPAAIEAERAKRESEQGPGVAPLDSRQPEQRDHTTGTPALSTLPEQPTIDQIIASVAERDQQLAAMLKQHLNVDVEGLTSAAYAGALDPTILFRSFKNISGDFVRAAKFIAEQSVLYAMNPQVAKIFNPAYFQVMMIPGVMGHAETTVDTALATMADVAQAHDAVVRLDARINDTPGHADNMFTERDTSFEQQAYTVDSLVDDALAGKTFGSALKRVDTPAGAIMAFDHSQQYTTNNGFDRGAVLRARSGATSVRSSSGKLVASAATNGIVRVPIKGEDDDGAKLTRTQDPSDGASGIDDDDARVPISFTDLRMVPGERYRSVYFQPLNLTVSESTSPQYSEQQPFGRTDAAVTYIGTARSLSVSFELHVFAPEDLERMHMKINHLRSMVYPSYGADGLMRSGPVTRMRIGDLFRSGEGGLPGVIKSLSVDFNEALWELRRGMKVPRSASVTIDFLVLHDGPVGQLDGVFGVLKLPAGGFIGRDSTQRDGAQTTVAEAIPDKFIRMPRR